MFMKRNLDKIIFVINKEANKNEQLILPLTKGLLNSIEFLYLFFIEFH